MNSAVHTTDMHVATLSTKVRKGKEGEQVSSVPIQNRENAKSPLNKTKKGCNSVFYGSMRNLFLVLRSVQREKEVVEFQRTSTHKHAGHQRW
jgi:hypothetical protein